MLPDINDPEFLSFVERGIPLADLERRLRPSQKREYDIEVDAHAGFGDYSQEGFIGPKEDLLQRIHEDWQVVEQYGTTHAKIADALERLFQLGEAESTRLMKGWDSPQYKIMKGLGILNIMPASWKQKLGMLESIADAKVAQTYLAENVEYDLPVVFTMGTQPCPWGCKASGQNQGTLHYKNLTEVQKQIVMFGQMGGVSQWEDIIREVNDDLRERGTDNAEIDYIDQALNYQSNTIFYAPLTGLLPHLIREHHFFEGLDTAYRADPEFIIKALKLDHT